MKKYLYQLFVALLALFSFTIVSCNESEDDDSGQTIEINGKNYKISRWSEFTGSWEEELNEGTFNITVDREYYGTIEMDLYDFKFSNATCPKKGDDVSKMDLTLIPITMETDDPLWDNEYTYVSGHAIVTKTNPKNSELTIKFENLVMKKDSKSYRFNGTVTMTFFFYGF